ncbi:MAG: GNAT family N-acetyltransferase [Clostridiales bacterium]|nr:GNAT family N-acetyltransferase [Clostridiales bacterium]
MIRLANERDAQSLHRLNEAFNGSGLTTPERIRDSLCRNRQEVVVVAQEGADLVGFVCVQLKRSFCYEAAMPEVTELYVEPAWRRQGLAARMLAFAEVECRSRGPMQKFELLTGQGNLIAQAVYHKSGYVDDHKLHLSKPDATSKNHS